jgi:hypothetical protein
MTSNLQELLGDDFLAEIEIKRRNKTLLATQGIIEQAALDFYLRYGGNREEIKSEAVEYFFVAYDSFDSSKKTKFTSWLYIKVWHGLLDSQKKVIWRQKLLGVPVELTNEIPREESNFDINVFTEGMTEDAKYVVTTVISCPDKLKEKIKVRDNGLAMRKRVREYLVEQGWGLSRIAETFEEITKALYA